MTGNESKTYIADYHSPLGMITMASDGTALIGLWFDGQKHFCSSISEEVESKELPIFVETRTWLDSYFSGDNPRTKPYTRFTIGSAFQKEVWQILKEIPYGETITYGEIARMVAHRRGIESMSAQAVGGAVGRNPISVIVPCHRVIGAKGKLTGYAGGVWRKVRLLEIENKSNVFNKKATV